MGGFGSGRPSGSGRGTVKASQSLDVNLLHREGCLRAGWAGDWQWTHDGELDDAVFQIAATFPMEKMRTGVVREGLPFDVEEFVKQIGTR